MKTTRFLAAVSVATLSTSAWAQLSSFTYTDKDLLVAFTTTATDFVVDLGPASSFQSGSNIDFAAASGGSKYNVSDLLSAFGGSLSGVNWTVFGGANPSTPHDVWISLAQPDTTPTGLKASTATSDSSFVKTTGNDLNTIAGTSGASTFNSATAISYSNSATLASQDGFSALNKRADQGTASGIYTITSQQENNLLGQTSDLYKLAAGPNNSTRGAVTLLGPLELESNGHLVFNPVVVPEPQDYAAIAGGALVAGALLRRRFQRR